MGADQRVIGAAVLPHVGRANLRDEVAEILEERILDGSFAPGSRVPSELDLAEQLGVSRTVVRDALRTLEARGLLVIRRGLGTIVKPASAEAYTDALAMVLLRSDLTFGDVFEARVALEGQLAFVAAANHTETQLAAMYTALEVYEAAVAAGEEGAIVAAHVEFHTALLRATNLPALNVVLGPVQALMLATSICADGFDPGDPRSWRPDVHRRLVEAVDSRDPAAVAQANELHWSPPINDDSYRSLRQARIADRFATAGELRRGVRLASTSPLSGQRDPVATLLGGERGGLTTPSARKGGAPTTRG